jgi:hypothetical protein
MTNFDVAGQVTWTRTDGAEASAAGDDAEAVFNEAF